RHHRRRVRGRTLARRLGGPPHDAPQSPDAHAAALGPAMSAPRPGSVRVTGRSRAWLAAYALLAAGCGAPSQEGGFVERTLMWRGVPRPYQVWVPPAYSRQHRWPVILFLHGSGERGSDGRRQIE